MRAVRKFGLFYVALAACILSGCAPSGNIYQRMSAAGYNAYGDKKVYGEWRPIPDSKAPALARIVTVFKFPELHPNTTTAYFEIKNISTGKLQIVGLCTTNKRLRFIDFNQNGTFNLTLYPGQSDIAVPDDHVAGDEKTFYIFVQDFAVTK